MGKMLSSKFSLALQPEGLVNISERVDFSSRVCIRETPKRVILQIVKTLMKCRMMRHFIIATLFVYVKLDLRKVFFKNYNLTCLDNIKWTMPSLLYQTSR